MDCCAINGLDQMFDESLAKRELKSYRKNGLDERARKLADFLKAEGISGASVLEIGCGIGALHLELLKGGATSATGVDVSREYIKAAENLARTHGLEDAVEYRVGDFVELEREAPHADVTLLDRVICCYPSMRELVTASARHTGRLYALTYPRWTWWIRAGAFLENLGYRVLRKRFRAFMHRPQELKAILAAEGFAPAFEARSGTWAVEVHRRRAAREEPAG